MALAAGTNLDELARPDPRHRPELVSVADASAAPTNCASGCARQVAKIRCRKFSYGRDGICSPWRPIPSEIVVSAAVGVVGLRSHLRGRRAGKQVALSNKEVLVAAGELVMAAAAQAERRTAARGQRAQRHPPMPARRQRRRSEPPGADGIGGPFRKTPLAEMADVTPEQALAHPNWQMGKRITIDSATMMNKGFEVIEARWLFGMRSDQIDVVIHPQSTIHSMVEYVDGSILAQLGPTDMRMPIQYALTYPERVASNECALDWPKLRRLDFAKVPTRRFPCLRLAREACGRAGHCRVR